MPILALNKRGYTLCASTAFILLLLATTTLFLYPESIDTTYITSRPSSDNYYEEHSTWRTSPAQSDSSSGQPAQSWNDQDTSIPPTSPPVGGWTFNTQRDERDFGLSDEQCSAAFPKFYAEIDRAVQFRKEKNLPNITSDLVDIQWRPDEIMRVMIYDNQLYVLDAKWAGHGMDVPRALSLLHSINRAIIAYRGTIPNIEFSFCLSDWPNDHEHKYPLWVLTRHVNEDEEKWVMPDFGYWSWPGPFMGEYSKLRSEIFENEPTSWEKKKPKAVWRGATATNDLRNKLVDVSKGKKWADVKAIDWGKKDSLDKDGVSIPEHCNYQYVLHTEGHSYSGRAKYLLNCKSVSVVHTVEWIEPHSHLFISDGPEQNMVSVERDFKDLDTKMNYYLKHPQEAKQIAENSAKLFRDRYLTPAAQACYWRRLFNAWASVSFEPELYTDVTGHDGKKRRRVRGTTFETYVSDLVFAKEG